MRVSSRFHPKTLHERAVDLDGADRQLAQQRQGRVAGPEVVEREVNPQCTEAVELAGTGYLVVHRCALGQFQGQRTGREARRRQSVLYSSNEIVVGELRGGDVDGEADLVLFGEPRRRVPGGDLQDAPAEGRG